MLRLAPFIALTFCLGLYPRVSDGQENVEPASIPAAELQVDGVVNTTHGAEGIRLSKLRDRVVVLVFFFTEEPNTPKAMEQAQQLWEAYRRRGLEVIGIHSPPPGWRPTPERPGTAESVQAPARNHEEEIDRQVKAPQKRRADHVSQFAVRHQVAFPVVMDYDRMTWTRYGNVAYPTFYVIDHEGMIRGVYIGTQRYAELSDQVDRLLMTLDRARDEKRRNAASMPPTMP